MTVFTFAVRRESRRTLYSDQLISRITSSHIDNVVSAFSLRSSFVSIANKMRLSYSILSVLFLVSNASEGFMSPRVSRTYLPSCSIQRNHKSSSVTALPDVATVFSDPFLTMSSTLIAVETSPEPIHLAFSVATFLPQPFWLLIILFQKQKLTKQIMGGLGK